MTNIHKSKERMGKQLENHPRKSPTLSPNL